MNPEDLQTLVTMLMPFGQQKVKLLANLPGTYLTSGSRAKASPRASISRLLALMHEIDHNGLSDLLTPLRAGTNLLARGERECTTGSVS